jgi:hypothetical protein
VKNVLKVAVALGFVSSLSAVPALSQELPEHPHMLVLGLELDEDGEPVGYKKCIDLAANQALPLGAQHEHVHFGTAGQALFERAGHGVVGGAPFFDPEDPFPSNCAQLIDFYFS